MRRERSVGETTDPGEGTDQAAPRLQSCLERGVGSLASRPCTLPGREFAASYTVRQARATAQLAPMRGAGGHRDGAWSGCADLNHGELVHVSPREFVRKAIVWQVSRPGPPRSTA